MTWKDAERWRERLHQSLKVRDSRQLERVWKPGFDESLWEFFGYDSAEEFCRRELELELDDLFSMMSTQDLTA